MSGLYHAVQMLYFTAVAWRRKLVFYFSSKANKQNNNKNHQYQTSETVFLRFKSANLNQK